MQSVDQDRAPFSRSVTRFALAGLVAAAALAGLECARLLVVEPAARSGLVGPLFLLSLGAFLVPALPVALALAALEPKALRLPRPRPDTVLLWLLAVVLVWGGLTALRAGFASLTVDFPDLVGRVEHLAALLVTTAALGVAWLARPLLGALVERSPLLGAPDRALKLATLTVVVLLAGLLPHLLSGGHLSSWGLAPGLAALVLLMVLVRTALAAPPRRHVVLVAVGVAGTLAMSIGARHLPEATYLFHSSTALAREAVRLWSPVADPDGDGAWSAWFGGDDCAPFDSQRGPEAREQAGDDIDQDCRGGDATPAPVAPPAPDGWQGCRAPPPGGWSVLLITVDAVRAAALTPEVAPGIASLAGRSAWFTRAYAPTANTIPTFLSLFGGRPASGVATPDDRLLLDDDQWLPLRFERAGYRTGFAFPFEAPKELFAGFTEHGPAGVDYRPDGKLSFQSSDITRSAREHLARTPAGERFFFWAHYPDAHAPYLPLPESPAGASQLDRYLGEIRYVDGHVARLLNALVASEHGDSTVVVLTSDHGEDLGERGKEGHGPDLYERSVHVPLALYIPGCPGALVEKPVSVVDVYATVGALVGLAGETPSLFAAMEGRARPLPVVSETRFQDQRRRAVIAERYKLLVDLRTGGRLLFDLEQDPEERTSIYGAQPMTDEMEALYQRWLDRPPSP